MYRKYALMSTLVSTIEFTFKIYMKVKFEFTVKTLLLRSNFDVALGGICCSFN